MPLHTDYRPRCIDDIRGNEDTKESVTVALEKPETCNRSMLIHGAAGCGKTTLAYAIATELGSLLNFDLAESPDFYELNASDDRGVATVRHMRNVSQFKPRSEARVFFLDECHKLTPDAQEALLKPLENPPAKTWFILATTEPTKLTAALRRRCAEYRMEPLDELDIMKLLHTTARKEGKKVPKNIREMIAEDSNGSAGVALGILDQIIDLPPKRMEKVAKRAAERGDEFIQLCRDLVAAKSWKVVAKRLKGLEDTDPETIRRKVLEYCRRVMLSGDDSVYLILDAFREPFYNTGKAGLVLACYESLMRE